MTPEQLKASILQYAIQGKLVEQRPEEGTAEEYFINKCRYDKEKAISEGKYKKEKFRGRIQIENAPFVIPNSWMWMYISDMSLFQEGPGILGKDFRNKGVPLIRISGMQDDYVSLMGCNYLDPKMVDSKWSHFKLDLGDIVISTSASMDKIAEVTAESEGAIPYTGLIRFKMYGDISKEYFKWFIRSPFYMKQVEEQKSGGTIKHYGPTHLAKMVIPIPPLTEQHRIVSKIEQLLPLIDRYASSYEKLERFNARFPEDMKKSILQYAIQGKLVEQRPEEGTAEELYEKIREEKKRLIAEGKIKKEKPLPEITEDDIPFDIPESWKWVRLASLITVRGGKRIPAGHKLTTIPTDHIYIRVTDMQNGTILDNDLHYISDDIYEGISRYIITEDDLYIVIVGSTIGKCGLVPQKFSGMNLTENAARLTPYMVDINYLYIILSSYFMQKQFVDKTNQVGVPKLAIMRLETALIPLPPLKEQKRIVNKIQALLPYCEKLQKLY